MGDPRTDVHAAPAPASPARAIILIPGIGREERFAQRDRLVAHLQAMEDRAFEEPTEIEEIQAVVEVELPEFEDIDSSLEMLDVDDLLSGPDNEIDIDPQFTQERRTKSESAMDSALGDGAGDIGQGAGSGLAGDRNVWGSRRT